MTETPEQLLAACVRAELADRDLDDTFYVAVLWVADVAEMLAAANGCPATVGEIAEAILCDAEIES